MAAVSRQNRQLAEARITYAKRLEQEAQGMTRPVAAAEYRRIAATNREEARHLLAGCPGGACTGHTDRGECVIR